MKNKIFVFDSNLAGKHGKGTSITAYMKYGAIYGQSFGLQGSSFAIPTKDEQFKTLPVKSIAKYIDSFIKYAILNPDITFEVPRIACGIDSYEDVIVAPLFKNAPDNCLLPAGWRLLASTT
jgi:hypothetical protein